MKQKNLQAKNSEITTGRRTVVARNLAKQKYLLIMIVPGALVVLVFNYLPMYGVLTAFQDFRPIAGFFRSSWVGLKWFDTFFRNPYAYRLLRNTFLLGLYSLIFSFPAPLILALMLNETRNEGWKRTVQTISYLPHFISTVIIVGMLKEFTSLSGIFNKILSLLGFDRILFFAESGWFRPLFVGSGIWQGVGWGTILFLAALSGVNPELYEVAVLDGANRWHKIRHIDLPTISGTVVILLVLSIGGILGTDFQKILLMYNPLTYETADVVGTYVYRQGIESARYSYAAAVGLFMSVISLVLLVMANYASRRVSETSLW